MKKTKSFISIILLFSILFGLPLSRVSATSNYITLTSSPSGATVCINKVKQAELTPFTFNKKVPGARYTVIFSKVGYVAQTVQIPSSPATSKLTIVLKKVLMLKVTSSPSGATVYINNVKQAQITPCTLTGYAYGAILNFKLSKKGYLPFSQTFSTWTEGLSYISAKLLIMPPPPHPTFPGFPVIKLPTVVVPAVQYASTTAAENKTFAWTYATTTYTWQVQAPAALLSFSRAQPLYVAQFFASNGTSQSAPRASNFQTMLEESFATSPYGAYVAWTTEPQNTAYIKQLAPALAAAAKVSGYDYFHEAEFIQYFVQSAIPYVLKPTAFQQLPAQTLFDGGKCVDKSILCASLLVALGYKVALFGLPNANAALAGHEVIGIAFSPQQMPQTAGAFQPPYLKNGVNYYYAETTFQGYRLGELSSFPGDCTPQIPFIYPLN